MFFIDQMLNGVVKMRKNSGFIGKSEGMKKRTKTKDTKKLLLIIYLLIGTIIVLTAALKKALNNREYGTANYTMDRMSGNDSGLYNEFDYEIMDYTAAEMQRDGVNLDFSATETNKFGELGDIVLLLKKLYEQRDYASLYSYVDIAYLNSKGYYIYPDTYEKYHEGIVGNLKQYSLELDGYSTIAKNRYIVNGSYTEIITLPNGERGYSETDQAFSFTILLQEEGTFTYLPFNESDLFTVSDYGITRLQLN